MTSRKNCIVFVFLKKRTIMNENKRFVCELLFFENMTIINFFARNNLFLLHDLMRFQRRIIVAINVKMNCLRKYVDNVFCILFRNVRCDLKNAIQICFLQKLFKMIHSRDHAWSSHRQFFWLVKSCFWRMTHAHSRLSSDVCLFSICRTTSMMRRQAWQNISSNLRRAIYQIWRKRLIKLDESDSLKLDENNVISSNLMITSSHQTWDRHLIKFLKRQTIFRLSMSDLM